MNEYVLKVLRQAVNTVLINIKDKGVSYNTGTSLELRIS